MERISDTTRPSAPRGVFRRDVVLLLTSGAVLNVPVGFLAVAGPVYLERLPGIPTALVGLFFTLMGLVAVTLIIPVGIMADRVGRRPVMALGGIFAFGSLLTMAFVERLEALLAAAALMGTAEAFYFSTWNALLADATDAETRTTVFGISFFVTSVAMAAGNLMGIEADEAFRAGASPQASYQPVFLLLALLPLIVPVTVGLLRIRRGRTQRSEGLLPRRSLNVISRFFVANVLIGFGAGMIIPLFSLWFLLQFDVGEAYTGPLFAVSSIVNAFAFLVAPTLARRVGMIRAVVLAQGAATLVLVVIPLAVNVGSIALPAVASLYVLRNALMNMTWPVMSSFLMGAVDPAERSAASAVTGAAFRLPFAASTTLGSYLLTIDLSLPFYATAALYALGTSAFWYFFRAYEASTPEEAVAGQLAEAVTPK